MQWLKITNDTIYRNIKMGSLKVYNIEQMQKIATLNTCFCVVSRHPKTLISMTS